MRYTKNDIPRIPLTEFMEALGEKPVKSFENLRLYYSPHRDDPEPMLVVNTATNRWIDHTTKQTTDIIDLAALKMNPNLYTDPRDFILKYMNEYEHGKVIVSTLAEQEMVAQMGAKPVEPEVIKLNIKNIPIADFLKALGQERPVAADGDLRIYNAPYDNPPKPMMIVNLRTNLWRDTKSGAYGGIYDLAYEMTGSCNKSELSHYIAGEMGYYERSKANAVTVKDTDAPMKPGFEIPIQNFPREDAPKVLDKKPPQEEPPKPKRKMRL